MRRRLAQRWRRDERGATAVEFAIIGPLFLLIVMGVIEFGLELFTQLDLDNAVHNASRLIEIGQAPTQSSFVSSVCAAAGPLIPSCSTGTPSLQINVVSGPTFAGLAPATINGSGILSASNYSPGSAGSAVLVQVAYTRAFDIQWLTKLCGGSPTLLSTFAVMQEPAAS